MGPADLDLTTDDATTAPLSTAPTNTNRLATCPECGQTKMCRARRQGLDRVISLVNIYPYSCRTHTCQARFYRFGRSKR
jgi:hypothetical protein